VIEDIKIKGNKVLESMASVGLHFGAPRSRRHPSTKAFSFGVKNDIEIIDLEKTLVGLDKVKEFVKKLAGEGKKFMLVGNKSEARDAVEKAGEKADLPWVALRWIGGTLTNFDEIRKRVDRLADLETKGASGELGKYTKKERARIGHEVKDLKRFFSGIINMSQLPSAMFVIDSDKEAIAITEAKKINIPVISLSSTDCDISLVDFPIVGNDKSAGSIKFIVEQIVEAYRGK